MISLRFQSKAPAKYQEFFFSPYTLFNPLNAHIPTDLTFPCPPPPTQFTLTKTETSMYLTFILQFLTCTIQCLTSTFSLLDLPNEQSHTDFTTPYLRLSLFGPSKRTLTCTNISPYSTLILTLTYPPPPQCTLTFPYPYSILPPPPPPMHTHPGTSCFPPP